MARKAFILSSCDEWKSYASFSQLGVFTNIAKMKRTIRKLCKLGYCEKEQIKDLRNMSVRDMQIQIDYIHIAELELNTVQ